MSSEKSVNVNYFQEASKMMDTWPLMGSPWPILSILFCYLLFVLKLGPQFMEKRKPFNIKYIILLYNLYQTLSNFYMVCQVFIIKDSMDIMFYNWCKPKDRATNDNWIPTVYVSWLYLVSKVADLLDTVFFVLRKKQSHVTFLHVYHHTNMVFAVWFFNKYFKSEQSILVGLINAGVHVFMYSYYFLAALGPSVQKYLWWKKYITRLQLVQFVIIFIYMCTIIVLDCPMPKYYTYFCLAQSVLFFVLFMKFYLTAYGKNTNQSSTANQLQDTKRKLI